VPLGISLNHRPLRFDSGLLFRRLLKLRLAIADGWSAFNWSNRFVAEEVRDPNFERTTIGGRFVQEAPAPESALADD
jgi:hypothetical protein